MKQNELRIGNIVHVVDGFVSGNIPIDMGMMAQLHYNHIQVTPIPLTEEWLVRAGFEIVKRIYQHPLDRSDYTLMSFKFKNFEAKRYHYVATGEDTHGWEFKCYDKMIPIWIGVTDYVHQLQNLYFALTGEELNFANVK